MIELIKASYHRNGISGNGFYACLFKWRDGDKTRNMVASIFDESGSCAVYDVDELAKGNIEFARGNSWRGDHFENDLRALIRSQDTGRFGPFSIPPADTVMQTIKEVLDKK